MQPGPLIFIHAVTGPAALRSLLPHLPQALGAPCSPMSGRPRPRGRLLLAVTPRLHHGRTPLSQHRRERSWRGLSTPATITPSSSWPRVCRSTTYTPGQSIYKRPWTGLRACWQRGLEQCGAGGGGPRDPLGPGGETSDRPRGPEVPERRSVAASPHAASTGVVLPSAPAPAIVGRRRGKAAPMNHPRPAAPDAMPSATILGVTRPRTIPAVIKRNTLLLATAQAFVGVGEPDGAKPRSDHGHTAPRLPSSRWPRHQHPRRVPSRRLSRRPCRRYLRSTHGLLADSS